MALPGNKNFSDYDNYITDQNPTTSAQAQDYFRNQAELLKAVIDCDFWQPETVYQPGDVVKSDSMPNGTEAVMVATKASVTSNVEPQWGAVGGANISDGACFWKLRWQHWSKDVEQITDLTTGATNRLPNTSYAVGNVVYDRSNLSVALKCTQAGTTSNSELDISGKVVGESVEDGSVVWEVVSRDTVATIDQQRPIKTFTSLEQLGLPETCTPKDIAEAMPSNSMLNVDVNTSSGLNPNLGLNDYGDGLLIVTKHNLSTVSFIYQQASSTQLRYAHYVCWMPTESDRFNGWHTLARQGALSMPSRNGLYVSVNFIPNATNNQYEIDYTPPADGWMRAEASVNNGEQHWLALFPKEYYSSVGTFIGWENWAAGAVYLPVRKNETITIGYVNVDGLDVRFYYAQSEV